MKKALFLYSELTGVSYKKGRMPKAIERLGKIFDLTVCKTSSLEELKEKASSACSVFDALIVVGGDGTFHQVINVVADAENKPVLGFLNAGTMGDVAANFGSSHSFWEGVRIIENGCTAPLDLCKANDVYFAYMAAVGAYSDIAYEAKREKKKAFGKLAYYSLASKEAFKKQAIRLKLEVGGESIDYEGPFLMLLNGRRVGGFYVNKKGDAGDGVFEVYRTPKGVFNGLLRYLSPKKEWASGLSELRIVPPEELTWCLDGEKYVFRALNIKICPSKITVFSKGGKR